MQPIPTMGSKIIIGIDFGTTNTRVTYAHWDTNNPWLRDVYMARFGQNGSIPSTIGNGEGGACTWTKVLLDDNYRHAGYKSRVLRKALNSGYLNVPNSHFCEQVIATFLRHLLNSMVPFLEDVPGYDKQPVEYWFTIPGVYSGAARARMSNAIQNAGYVNRQQDSVHLLSEGEAAAVAVQHLLPNAEAGNRFLIVDCGGGTTDVTAIEITDTGMGRNFTNLSSSIGLHGGGTEVDCEVVLALESQFQDLSVRKWNAAALGDFMRNIERLNMVFSGAQARSITTPMGDSLILETEKMREAVDKVVCRIATLAVTAASQTGGIQTGIVVGGFSQCIYLQHQLRKDLEKIKCSLTVMPSHMPQLVSRGATLFGLEQAHRQSGLSCKNYGLESVLNPGPGIAGDPSPVPCWIIRMNEHFQKARPGQLQVTLLHDSRGTNVQTIPIIQSSSGIAPVTRDDSVQVISRIVCNLENVSLPNPAVWQQPIYGSVGTIYTLTATVNWQVLEDPARIEFSAYILGIHVGSMMVRINY